MPSHYEKRELLRLARSGHTCRLRQLLERGVEVNFLHQKTGMTPLMTAAYAGRTEAVQLLLEHHANPNLNADDNASALHWACRFGAVTIVRMLIDAGADLNIRRSADRGGDGPAPIHMALPNHEDVAITLIDAGASVDIRYLGDTVVEYAERYGCRRLVQHVHQAGARR